MINKIEYNKYYLELSINENIVTNEKGISEKEIESFLIELFDLDINERERALSELLFDTKTILTHKAYPKQIAETLIFYSQKYLQNYNINIIKLSLQKEEK